MYLRVSVSYMTRQLFSGTIVLKGRGSRQITEFFRGLIPFLNLHFCIVQRATVNSWRRTGFHSSAFKAHLDQLFRNSMTGSFARTASAKLLFPYMNNTVKKSAVGKHHCPGAKFYAQSGDNSLHSFTVFAD